MVETNFELPREKDRVVNLRLNFMLQVDAYTSLYGTRHECVTSLYLSVRGDTKLVRTQSRYKKCRERQGAGRVWTVD